MVCQTRLKPKCFPYASIGIPLLVGCYPKDRLLRMYNLQAWKLTSFYCSQQTTGINPHTMRTGMWPVRWGRKLCRRSAGSPRFIHPTCSVTFERVPLTGLFHHQVWQIVSWCFTASRTPSPSRSSEWLGLAIASPFGQPLPWQLPVHLGSPWPGNCQSIWAALGLAIASPFRQPLAG